MTRSGTHPTKVLLGKLGLDGHDRGVKVVVQRLRDHGMEVIYLGMRLTPEQVAAAALQEDPDVVGISMLSGAHMRLLPRLTGLLKEHGLDDVLVVVGGVIPDKDVPKLEKAGVHGIFSSSVSAEEIAQFIKDWVQRRKG